MINLALDFDEQLQKKYGEDYLWEDHKDEIFPDNDREGKDIEVGVEERERPEHDQGEQGKMGSICEHGESSDQQG
jgi:hypothetical protein